MKQPEKNTKPWVIYTRVSTEEQYPSDNASANLSSDHRWKFSDAVGRGHGCVIGVACVHTGDDVA